MAVDKEKTLEAFLELLEKLNPRQISEEDALLIYMKDGSEFRCRLHVRVTCEENVIRMIPRKNKVNG